MKAEAARGHDRYPCLDGLRALAVTSVFIFHAALGSAWIVRHAARYIAHFNIGVEIFFVLSGFLIYRPFVSANLAGRYAGRLRSYALRRCLRIFPAYLLALFVLLLLGDIHVDGMTGLIKHATLTNTYFHDIGGFGIAQSWTLVVELSFYAFVPLWSVLTHAVSRASSPFRTEIAGALALIVVGYLTSAWVFFGSPPPAVGVLPASLGALGGGMLLAVLSAASDKDEQLAARVTRLGRFPAVSWGIACALFMYLAWRPYDFLGSTPSELMWDRSLKVPIAFLLVLPAVFGAQHAGMVRRALSAAPVAYVGLVSYGIYIWHQRVSAHIATPDALNHHGALYAVGALVLAYGATVAVASVSFFAVERPMLRLARGPRVGTREPSASGPR
jgi:peptidoglycan/LPS O-acetylase OafA/YrhL